MDLFGLKTVISSEDPCQRGTADCEHDPQLVWGTALPDANKNYAVPQSVTVSGLSSSKGWNDALGLTSTSGANGESSSTGYNVSTFVGRPSSKTLPTGLTVSYGYTQNTVLETVNSVPLARWTRTTLDGFGRPEKVETGTGTPSAAGQTTNAVSEVDTEYEPCACTPIDRPVQWGGASSSSNSGLLMHEVLHNIGLFDHQEGAALVIAGGETRPYSIRLAADWF